VQLFDSSCSHYSSSVLTYTLLLFINRQMDHDDDDDSILSFDLEDHLADHQDDDDA
jgi:hypothetical protein